jgi:hypothetical protein
MARTDIGDPALASWDVVHGRPKSNLRRTSTGGSATKRLRAGEARTFREYQISSACWSFFAKVNPDPLLFLVIVSAGGERKLDVMVEGETREGALVRSISWFICAGVPSNLRKRLSEPYVSADARSCKRRRTLASPPRQFRPPSY